MRDTLGRFMKGHIEPISLRKRDGEKNPNYKGGLPYCIDCHEEISYGRTRCQSCYLKTVRGVGNPNWRGGKVNLIFSIRTSQRYKQWRSDVFKRDNWICQTCHRRGCYLEAHHIKSLADIVDNPKELWNIDNGVTLCKECHELTKHRNRKGKYAAAETAKAPAAK